MNFNDLAGVKSGEWYPLWLTLLQRLTTFTSSLEGTAATSATSLSIGAGSKAFTLNETDVEFPVGLPIRARRAADDSAFMVGLASASAAGSVTVEVTSIGGGGGPYTDWVLTVDITASPALIEARETDENGSVGASDAFSSVNVFDPAISAPDPITLTFDDATTIGDGKWGLISNRSGMLLTVAAAGGQTIDGRSSIAIPDGGSVLWLIEDGAITIPLSHLYGSVALGKHVFVLDAWCFKKAETNGPEAVTTAESSTHKIRLDCLAFDAATPETMQSRQAFGKSFDGATAFRARFCVGSRSGTGNVKLGVSGVSIRSGDDLDAAPGSEQTTVFNVAATGKLYWTEWTSAFTFGGTHADMAMKFVKVRRVADDNTNDVKSDDLDIYAVAFEPVFKLSNDA